MRRERGVAESHPVSRAAQRSPNKLWRSNSIFNLHQKKGNSFFRFQPGCHLSNSPRLELLNYSRRGRVWLLTSQLGTGKKITFFTVYVCLPAAPIVVRNRPTREVLVPPPPHEKNTFYKVQVHPTLPTVYKN